MDLSKDELALLRLSLTEGIGPVIGRGLLDHFGSAEALYRTPPKELTTLHELSPRLVQTLLSSDRPLRAVDEQLSFIAKDEAEGKPVKLLFLGEEGYPEALESCPDAPLVLYVKGDLPPDNPPMIGVVGTRRNTHYAEDALAYFIKGWAEARPDLVIVSGLAYGVDAISHNLALRLGLRTIGVVAHGLDTIYPSSHRKLASQMIEKGGAVVTEFPYGTRALPQRFIARNRIVAGLSLGLLVGESAAKGGALTTAGFALDYGRSVYAVPGRLFDTMSEGCNQLIYLNKAAIATSPRFILEDLGLLAGRPKSQALPFSEEDVAEELPEKEQDPVLRLLSGTDEMTVGELAARTGEAIPRLSGRLFMLEMEGRIRALPGGKYALIRTK